MLLPTKSMAQYIKLMSKKVMGILKFFRVWGLGHPANPNLNTFILLEEGN